MNKIQKKFFNLVETERKRQDELWGEQEHGEFVWTGILMSEIGDLHKVLLRYDENDDCIDKEIVHCASVLCAMYENRQRECGKDE